MQSSCLSRSVKETNKFVVARGRRPIWGGGGGGGRGREKGKERMNDGRVRARPRYSKTTRIENLLDY